MKPTKLAYLLVTLAAVLLLAVGCQQPAAAVPTPERVVVRETVMVQGTPQIVEKEVTKVVEKVVEKVVTAAPPAVKVDQARAETLNIAIGGRIADPTNLNLYAPGVSRSNTGLHQIIYEYLFYNNLQTGELIPWLAESFKYSDDFASLSVKLRDGVTWSDGKPFTADDVVFTYDLLRKTPGMTWAEEANKQVKSVDKVDNLNVKFNLNTANPRFHLNREAFPAVGIWGGITILPKHVWEGKDALTFKNSEPVATGPYKLKAATQTAMTYERRDDWWGTKVFKVTPGPKTINFKYLGPETNVALALANNELDSPNIGILSVGSFNEVSKRNPNVTAWQKEAPFSWLDPCPRPLMLQNGKPPFDKKEARWALSYMIDRKAVVDLAYEGATTTAWGIWPAYDGNKPYFDAIADLRKQFPTDVYDPKKAEELWKAAGIDPKTLNLVYLVDSDSNEEMKVSRVIADQLERAGLKVKLQPLNAATLADTILRGDYDMKLHSFCPGYIPENLELFHSKYYKPLGEKAPWYERNSFRYKNPKLDAAVDQMFTTKPDDTQKLVQLYKDAMTVWLDDLPVVPIVQAPALVPFNTTYWQGWPTATNAWNMPVSWWATFNLVINGYPDSKNPGKWISGIKSASAK